jgi:hypothetical protein
LFVIIPFAFVIVVVDALFCEITAPAARSSINNASSVVISVVSTTLF